MVPYNNDIIMINIVYYDAYHNPTEEVQSFSFTLSMLGKPIRGRHIEIVFLVSLENRFDILCKLSP